MLRRPRQTSHLGRVTKTVPVTLRHCPSAVSPLPSMVPAHIHRTGPALPFLLPRTAAVPQPPRIIKQTVRHSALIWKTRQSPRSVTLFLCGLLKEFNILFCLPIPFSFSISIYFLSFDWCWCKMPRCTRLAQHDAESHASHSHPGGPITPPPMLGR